MNPEESAAWTVFLMNGLNPKDWRFISIHRHDINKAQMVMEFENLSTRDRISLEHEEKPVKKNARIFK